MLRSELAAFREIFRREGTPSIIDGELFLVDQESLYGMLWQELAGIDVGESGYIYIVDAAGDLVLHPTPQGENLSERLPAAVRML